MGVFSSEGGFLFHFLRFFLSFHVRYNTERIRNVESRTFGKDGKNTHLSKKVMNFKDMPMVPHSSVICKQSSRRAVQFSCIAFICLRWFMLFFSNK